MTTPTTPAPTQGPDGFARPKNEEAPSGRDTGQGHRSKTEPRHDTPPAGIDGLLSRLAGVRQTGPDRWTARCPAHEDRSPSLSIRDTGERVLMNCFAGCHPEDVLAAVGLTWRDLRPDRDRWSAAFDAATATASHLAQQRRLRELRTMGGIDVDAERRLLLLAADEAERGMVHSLTDRARIEVAMERVAAADAAGGRHDDR